MHKRIPALALLAVLSGCAATISGLKEDGTRNETTIDAAARPLAECFVRHLDEQKPIVFWQYRTIGTADADIHGKIDAGWIVALYEFRQTAPAQTRLTAWYPYDETLSKVHFDQAMQWIHQCP